MNAKKFSDAMSELDTKYVDEALNYKKKVKKPVWVKWGAMAACLLVIIVAVIPFVQITQDKLPTEYIQRIDFNNAYYEVCEDSAILGRLGINTDITEADAGEAIIYLMKKTSAEHSEYVATTDTTNIILYSYADAPCEAVYVICDNGKYNAVVFCSYVLPDTESIPMEKLYNLYGINSSSDISSISVVDDWFEKNIIGATLTDSNVIADFYSASLVLQDYSNDAYHKMNYGHIATEEELLQAYEQTNDNKITFMLETVNGLRFSLEYDAEGGWIYSGGTMRYYQVTEEIANWFSNNLK
jgi:hypothetical protein